MKKILFLAIGLWASHDAAADEKPTGTAPKESTLITSEQGDYDSQKRIVTLTGHVVVTDVKIHLTAERMIIFFDEKNQVSRIEANDQVVITQEDKSTHSDLAVYTPGDGRVVLTGHPSAVMPQGTIQGDEIVFYRETHKMTVKPARMIIQSGAAGLGDVFPTPKIPKTPKKP